MSSLIGPATALARPEREADDRLLYLQKILNSRSFRRSNRIGRFLSYLVSQSLSGTPEAPKEYELGIEVFDRESDYDPRLDPIVRVEARRLRIKLTQYYEIEGTLDQLRIVMPDRGYKLKFLRNDDPVDPVVAFSSVSSNAGSTAVLPLVCVDQDPQSRSFADGLTDELAYQLFGIAGLKIVARTSSFQFKDRYADVRDIGAELDAEYIVEGSVRKERKVARILIQIVHVSSGFRVWSGDYEEKISSVLAAQKSLAKRIVADFTPVLTQQQSLHPISRPDYLRTVFGLYQKGRRHLDCRTEDGIRRSIECFQQAIAHDSKSALAHAGLADGYSLAARYDVFPAQESWLKARSAAMDAIRIDGTLAEAHAALAFVQLHHGRDWLSAEREFCAAIQLNPHYAPARRWYGWCLAASGRSDLALVNFKRALDLDPLSPNANADFALALYFSRSYTECISQCKKTLRLTPGFYRAHQLLGLSYLQTGCYERAVSSFQDAVAAAGRNTRMLALMAHAYAAMNDTEAITRLCLEVRQRPPGKVSAMDFVLLHSASGDFDQAFQCLAQAFAEEDGELIWLPVDPIYECLRQDSRFLSFLERVPAAARAGR